jgi:DNA-binding CsgD family transcriptional regulator
MADSLQTAAFSELISSIYDCVLAPERWGQTLIDLARAFDTQVAMLTLVDRRQGRLLIEETVGVEKRWLEELQKHIPEINQILAAFYSHLPQDEPRIVSRDIPVAYCQTSPYIREFLRPQGIVDSMLYYLIDTPTRYSAFAVSKSEHLITAQEIKIGALLLPHIRRAVTISNVLDARTIERSRMAEALDGLRSAVILTDERGSVLRANCAAENMLRAASLVTTTGGVLHARLPSAAGELRIAISVAARNEADIGKTGLAIRLTDPDVPPIFAHVLPMTGSELRTRLQPSAAAAIFIGALPDEEGAADIMTAAFGLTPAEKRVLTGLLAGRTLAETAAALGVAATTAKSQLERIFSKTGVSRQADLILLATRLTPPTAAGPQS